MGNRLNRENGGTRKSRTEYPVKRERFCAVWEAADSLQEVCRILNMPPDVAMARASQYRAKGIPLRKFQGGRRKAAPLAEVAGPDLDVLVQRMRQQRAMPAGDRIETLRRILVELNHGRASDRHDQSGPSSSN